MKHLTQWILALLALAAVANFSGAFTRVQEPPKPSTPAKQDKPHPDKPPAKKLQQKNRQARQAALKAVLPTLKTSLSEAITLAQTETKGVAYSAGVEIIDGKASIQVDLFVNDKFTVADVNPETKKVTVAAKKGEENEEGEGGGDEKGD